jgi:hypothetical protein
VTKVFLKFEIDSGRFYRNLDTETSDYSNPLIIGIEYFITPFHSILITQNQPPQLSLHSSADSPLLSAVGNEYNMVYNDCIDIDLPEEGVCFYKLKTGDVITITESNQFVKVIKIRVLGIFP